MPTQTKEECPTLADVAEAAREMLKEMLLKSVAFSEPWVSPIRSVQVEYRPTFRELARIEARSIEVKDMSGVILRLIIREDEQVLLVRPSIGRAWEYVEDQYPSCHAKLSEILEIPNLAAA